MAARATGEFSVVFSPDSVSFTGSEPLQSEYVDDVFNAAVGNAIPGDAEWSGMTVENPFSLPKGVIAVSVDGVAHIELPSNTKTYAMEGNDADESLSAMISELQASSKVVCDINLIDEVGEGVENYNLCFGDTPVPDIKTKSLNPVLHSADRDFIQAIGLIKAAFGNLDKLTKTSHFLFFRLSLEPISKAHGEKSEAMNEATKLLADAISELNIAVQNLKDNKLIVAITNKAISGRTKRQTEDKASPDAAPAAAAPATAADAPNNPEAPNASSNEDYNIASYYSEDYPVIFNIILWFMVTFGFSLLAICYAIGTMDPGRDSIIYRMTSTRMKKDN